MPLRGTSCGAQRDRSKPSKATVPRLRGARPMMARSVVVFPTPLRPNNAAHSPALTSRFTPCRMCSSPIWTWTSSSLSMGLLDIVLVVLATEISLADALVRGDFSRLAGCENRPLRHHGDVVRDLEYHPHVVLDYDDIDRARELADFFDGTLGFGRAHAASRLSSCSRSR